MSTKYTRAAFLGLLVLPLHVIADDDKGGFFEKCGSAWELDYSTGAMTATCLNNQQEEVESSLDLNTCIANDGGKFVPKEDGNAFNGETCILCEFQSEFLECMCRDNDDLYQKATINLDKLIADRDGQLFCDLPDEDPAPPSDDKCDLPFGNGEPQEHLHTWQDSGAADFLWDWLTNNGTDDWVNQLFTDVEGRTMDCASFPGGTQCQKDGKCSTKSDPAMYFIELSVTNFRDFFDKVHERTQDALVTNLTSDVEAITEDFAYQESKLPKVVSILAGAFTVGAGFGAARAPVTGILTSGAGLFSTVGAAGSDGDLDLEGELSDHLEELYAGIKEQMAKTVQAAFGGNFEGIEAPNYDLEDDSDKVDWIYYYFKDGRMLDHNMVEEAVQALMAETRTAVSRSLVVKAMNILGWELWKYTTGDDGCNEHEFNIDGQCLKIVEPGTGCSNQLTCQTTPEEAEENAVREENAIKKYFSDYDEVLRNAYECNGEGDPDLSSRISYDDNEQPLLPKCFVNLKVKELSNGS